VTGGERERERETKRVSLGQTMKNLSINEVWISIQYAAVMCGIKGCCLFIKKQIIIKGCRLPPKSIGNEWVVVAVSLTHAWCEHYQKPNSLTIASPQGINYWYHKRYQGSSNVENKNQISKHLTLIFHQD